MKLNKIYCEDCLKTLNKIPNKYLNCVITSPPYWGLRNYGNNNNKIWNGNKYCNHKWSKKQGYENFCQKCGAWKGQLGLEPNPELYVSNLVSIFQEIKRVLKDNGTLWLNLGDTYYSSGGESRHIGYKDPKYKNGRNIDFKEPQTQPHSILKGKDLVGIPWRVAFALQKDGWYLRNDIIWQKPNSMPESVTDRFVKSHEHIFLLTKSKKYYFNQQHENCITGNGKKQGVVKGKRFGGKLNAKGTVSGYNQRIIKNKFKGRNKRDVWQINTKSFPEAHFAVYPPDLIRPCIKAGCPNNGIVYDPFIGAGTTGLVALEEEKKFIGSEISKKYVDIANRRINKVKKEKYKNKKQKEKYKSILNNFK